MTRLPLLGDADISSTSLSRARFGFIPNLYRALANAPAMLDAWIEFAWTLRDACTSSRGVRELCILRVATLTDAEYEWDAHVPMALGAGVSPTQLEDLATWSTSPHFSALERAALAATDELIERSELADTTWAELHAQFGDQQSVEVVLTISFYACVSRVLHGLAIPLELNRWADDTPSMPRPRW